MGDGKIQVFVSYAHEDLRHLQQFWKHIADLRRNKMTVFHDKEIRPGERWESVIIEELDAADVVVFLISASFVASDFCHQREFERALVRERADQCKIFPINLEPVDLDSGHPLLSLQYIPHDKSISEIRSRAAAWKQVARALRTCVDELLNLKSLNPPERDVAQLPQNIILISERRNKTTPHGKLRGGSTSQSRYMRPSGYPPKEEQPIADWQYFIHLLRETRFDDTDWQSLAISTRHLREALEHARPPADFSSARAGSLMRELQYTLTSALKPSATSSSIHAASRTCERLRTRLLYILTSSGV